MAIEAVDWFIQTVWLFLPAKRNPIPALLGYSATGPSPEPTKAPVKSPPPKNR